ncbi:uncharacterized protein LOC116621512 isoform X2 [Nematostella vectensis]|uniref:uncharacterized protein LOC116621512 isoform X2 n=1 Tax=Nematostella vectensis TaxID=45351 RepID=UPI00207729F8|nr:uncharacterized protein LOC116621512 isoform X2 [Nematostella vectensis]
MAEHGVKLKDIMIEIVKCARVESQKTKKFEVSVVSRLFSRRLLLMLMALLLVVPLGWQLRFSTDFLHPLLQGWRYGGDFNPDINSTSNNYTAEPKPCKLNAMANVLLIIAFMDTSYHKISVLEKLYREHFPNIVYCGPQKARTLEGLEILVAHVQHGITAYNCITGAMDLHPHHKGYLFIKSSVFVNYWRLAELDLNVLWRESMLSGQTMFEQSRDPWIWWYTPWGLKACEKVFKRMIAINAEGKARRTKQKDALKQNVDLDVQNSLNALLWNGRGSYKCYYGNSNVIYIPGKLVPGVQALLGLFEEFQVYVDITLATVIQMLELDHKVVQLQGVDLGAMYGEERASRDRSLFWSHLNSSVVYTKPLGVPATARGQSLAGSLLERMRNKENCTDNRQSRTDLLRYFMKNQ